eukprot:4948926-Alexandrium_andersonii.AAC.1
MRALRGQRGQPQTKQAILQELHLSATIALGRQAFEALRAERRVNAIGAICLQLREQLHNIRPGRAHSEERP